MTTTPFLTVRLSSRKHALLARQRARRVAALLQFEAHEQACIAAGVFVIACQALVLFGKARLCFQIENHQLQVFAAEDADGRQLPAPLSKRLAGLFPDVDPKSLYRLTKPMPPQDGAAEELDLAWLVESIEAKTPHGMFAEIVKQNQEILALLHELRLYQAHQTEIGEKPANPHAA